MFDRTTARQPPRHRRAGRRLGVFAAALLLTLPVGATTMPERSAAEVAAASALVVEATVLDARVVRVERRIVTVTELRVERVLRSAEPGVAPTVVTVALPGGELAGIAQKVPGTPELRVGARYLLCLSAEVLAGARAVVGLWQGAWLVDGGALRPFTPAGLAPAPLARASLERAFAGAP
ncbi:MAG: hypothetical protein HYS27_20570 [Deltaproteobacteria bacterium]|nr:hypothetical protein [Deltaproteobacteria bacterium]